MWVICRLSYSSPGQIHLRSSSRGTLTQSSWEPSFLPSQLSETKEYRPLFLLQSQRSSSYSLTEQLTPGQQGSLPQDPGIMMDRRKATATAPQPGEGTQPTNKHSVEGNTSNDDNCKPHVSKRGKRDSTEKGQGSIKRMFPPPHCCYLNMPSLRHFTSLPPPCPVIDDLTAPTAIIGVTTNELWLKRDDMFYNMNHETCCFVPTQEPYTD